MRVLWLCNVIPGPVRQALGGSADGGVWIEHVLSDIRGRGGISLRLLCLGGKTSGTLEDGTEYALFQEKKAYIYNHALEEFFSQQLRSFQPDVIHIWGTEYGHTLAMVNAAETLGMLPNVVISIQGLVGICARHMLEGIPAREHHKSTLRNVLRKDNLRQQQRDFELRGQMERRALEKVSHVIGRTDWDRFVSAQYHPDRVYHFCNETLRQSFYQGCWRYDRCQKHRIFTSSCVYPVKGFHYLLEAFSIVLTQYPDATLSVTGDSIFANGVKQKLLQQYYFRYLERISREKGLTDKIEFLGDLNADQMKKAYLESNVYVLPSNIENSSNSLGEAMLLGVPCVAADVGGISNMLHPGEGYLYPSTAPYMLAGYIMEVFRQSDEAEKMGARAREHARSTHDPEENFQALLGIYREISGKEG